MSIFSSRAPFLLFSYMNIIIIFLHGKPQTANAETQKNLIVAGYLPDYRFYINLNAASIFLTDLIIFSIAPNKDGSIDNACCLDKHHYEKAREAREYKRTYMAEKRVDGETVDTSSKLNHIQMFKSY